MNKLRVLAIFSIIGGGLQILSPIWYHILDLENLAVVIGGGIADLVSMIFILLGLIAIFSHQNKISSNWTVSFIIAFIGTALVASTKWIHAFVEPALMQHAPDLIQSGPPSPIGEAMFLSYIIFALSWIYFGISSLLVKTLPLIGCILILLAPVLDFVPIGNMFSQSVWGLGIIWLSLSVMTSKEYADVHQEKLSL